MVRSANRVSPIYFMKHQQLFNPQLILLPSTHSVKQDEETQSKSLGPLSNRKNIAQQLTYDIIHTIQEEIMESKITISSSRRIPLLNNPAHDEPNPQNLHQIVKRRKELDEEITRLKYEESRVKQRHRKSADRKEKSEFTKEEQQQISRVLHSQRQFQQELELKKKRLEEAVKEQRQQEEAERKARMEEACLEKQKRIAEHLKELEKKKEQREKEIKSLNKNFQLIKRRTFLHQMMEATWKHQQMQQEEAEKGMLELRKKGKEFSMSNIIEHEKKYKTFVKSISQQKEKKQRQAKLQKQIVEKQTLNHYQPSPFLQTIFQEEKKMKEAQEQRNQTIKSLVQTKNKYGEIIRQMNKESIEKKISLPPINEKQQEHANKSQMSKGKPATGNVSSKSMSRFQIAEIGNRYLREVHSSMDHMDKNKSLKVIPQQKQKQRQPQKYRDYLQEMKRKRAQKPSNNNEPKEMSELKQVLKRNSNKEDKLYYARLLAGKIEEKARSNSHLLASSINAKLAILSQISN